MSVEVIMPQMGESITEGTVSRWLKKVGDKVEKDESILEISTDKVDAEVPSPAGGILLAINVPEGETVEVGTALAVVGQEGESAAAPASSVSEPVSAPKTAPAVEKAVESVPAPSEPTPAPAPHSSASVSGGGASVDVVMPQMGESITEGTVSKWLKAVGDTVEKDEALLEISTDKVDAEVPSPAGGKVLSINVKEGETVEVGSVLATVGSSAGAAASQPAATAEPAPAAPIEPAAPVAASAPAAPVAVAAAAAPKGGNGSIDELRRAKSSPLVRNIAKEHGIDITRIPGSGISGRVTKNDILSFIETGAALHPEDLLVKGAPAFPTRQAVPAARSSVPAAAPSFTPSTAPITMDDRVEKMSVMRKKIAEHMTFSKQTSAHVTSVYEIDMTNVAKFRKANQAAFQAKYGTKLTFMPFIFEAVVAAIREHRIVNAQVNGDEIIYKGDINLGMAVALDWGLIVPVIKGAGSLSLAELAVTANDLADRARTKKLSPDEVQGGTFTITNPGVFGGLFGTPIINQPQVAILCVGTIEKRTKVMTSADGEDFIAIRNLAYFALTYDHRIVDGADAEKFLSYLKNYLENAEFSI
ncbi:MAG: 2-oxoglutarate dehydrogenase, E2 component, dihydrolipoamide succinyltransferase [Acidobacteria bacterium OLB17]|nr:MAG: 2-oxoglutarate dehydrogenase, E2 component, dihydrolipoamide succinyltransferase [Acidobacteria bacterium OLB17]MCZ2391097.1 2-oxoglutarate dehydrogenase, E2 component, dihydrolipoamide succinyltransferase [Acidobacteriota bacterium]